MTAAKRRHPTAFDLRELQAVAGYRRPAVAEGQRTPQESSHPAGLDWKELTHLQIDLDCLTSILGLGVKCQSSDRNPTNQNMSNQSLTAVVVNRLRQQVCVWTLFFGRKDVDTE